MNTNMNTSDENYTVILLGPPLAGKGTVASRLSSDAKLLHLSTGNIFRENIANETPLGIEAKKYMDGGNLVPDEVTIAMVLETISADPGVNGYLLDGFPRTLPQAEAFQQQVSNPEKVLVVLIDVDDEVLIERAASRFTCTQCGQTYSQVVPSKEEGVCDVCGGELIRRPDDEPEVTSERLKVYHKQTEPLVAFYENLGILDIVDGDNDPDTVYNAALDIVAKKMDLQ